MINTKCPMCGNECHENESNIRDPYDTILKARFIEKIKEIYKYELRLFNPPSTWAIIKLFWKYFIIRVEKEL